MKPGLVSTVDEGAVELFLACARLSKGCTWTPGPNDFNEILRITSLLEGMPLAIELTAAAYGRRSLEQIANGLESLAAGPAFETPGELATHRLCLWQCLDWAYGLLESWARDALLKLSIFPGSFAPETATIVCELRDTAAILLRLEDGAFLRRHKVDGRSRFTMPQPLRHFASRKLAGTGTLELLRRRFVRHFSELSRLRRVAQDGNDEYTRTLDASAWFAAERPNLLAAAEAASELKWAPHRFG